MKLIGENLTLTGEHIARVSEYIKTITTNEGFYSYCPLASENGKFASRIGGIGETTLWILQEPVIQALKAK